MVSAILGGVTGSINTVGGLIKGKQDMKMQKEQNMANITLAAMKAKSAQQAAKAQAESDKQKAKTKGLYIALAAFMVALLFIGVVLFIKRKS